MKLIVVPAWALLLLVMIGGPAATQPARSSTRGLVLGYHAVAVANEQAGPDTRHGGGAGVLLGYGITRTVLVLFDVDLAAGGFRDDRGPGLLGNADLAARLSPLTGRGVFPYAQVAFSSQLREATSDRQLLGTGFTGGGGVEVVLGTRASLDGRLLRTWARYDELREHGTRVRDFVPFREPTTRLQIGLNWRPPSPEQ